MAITQKTFSVSDISIQVSADSIERKVRSLSGVRTASISIENHTLSVEFDDELIVRPYHTGCPGSRLPGLFERRDGRDIRPG